MVGFVLLLCGLAQSLAAQSAGAQNVEVTGTVIDSATGEPLPGAEVKLIRSWIDAPRFAATAGEGGRFSLSVPPATYWIYGQRVGYWPDLFSPDWKTVTVKKAPENITVKMARRAVITGRVVDDRDQPVDGAEVSFATPEAEPAAFYLRDIVHAAKGTMANERGEFRISLPPGKFRLKAAALGFDETFHVSEGDAKSARPVDAVAGRETPNVEIRLRRRVQFTISGAVSGRVAGDTQTIVSFGGIQIPTDAEGRFVLRGIPPGKRDIIAYGYPSMRMSSPIALEVTSASVSGVSLALVEPFTITAKVTGADLARSTVKLESTTFFRMNATTLDAEGVARWPDSAAGRYRVRVEPLPGDHYIKSVTFEGTATPGDQHLLLNRAAHLDVLLAPGAAVSGTFNGTALLMRLTPASGGEPRQAKVDLNGQYRFGNLPPGSYKLAVVKVDTGKESIQDAGPVEVKEGDRVTKNVEAKP